MTEGSTDASMAKIKRQLQFDSAPRKSFQTEQHLLMTPQSLQMLLNSSHGPEIDYYADQDHSGGKKTPIVKRKYFEKHQQQIFENQTTHNQDNYCKASLFQNCNKEAIAKSKEIDDRKNVELYDCGANLKMNSLSQLNQLKLFITQKQYNESILQFQIPIKKQKREQQEDQENQPHFMQARSQQGFTTEEKKVIYNSEYLQRLGLPIPETVVKQKLFQKENEVKKQIASSSIVQKDKGFILNNNNSKSLNQTLLQSKDISFRAPNQIDRKEKVILGIRGIPQKYNDKQQNGLNEGLQQSNNIIPKQTFNQQLPLQQQFEANIRKQNQLKELVIGQNNNNKNFVSLNKREVRKTNEQYQKIATFNNEKQITSAQENESRKIGQLGECKKHKIIEKFDIKQGHLMDRFRKETAQGQIVVPEPQFKQKDVNDIMEQEQENQLEQKSVDNITFQEQQIRRLLTENEKNTMIVAWVKKNLQDLNYWIQKSKSSVNVEFSEEKGQFKCTLSLSTTQKRDVIKVSSKSNSKKEARKNVMKKLAQKVILDDYLFWEGVTGRQYVESILNEYQEAKESAEGDAILKSIFADEDEIKQEKDKQFHQQKVFENKKREDKDRGDQDKFKVSKLIRQMQNFLKEDKVIEALEKLSSIAALEVEITFKEASFIWNYAVQKGNLILLKIILDVIHYRKFSPQMLQTLNLQQTHPEQAMSELLGQFSQATQSRRLKNVNDILKKCLSVQRTLLTVNPFEQVNDKLQDQQSSIQSLDQPKQTQINSETFSILNSLSQIESLNFLTDKIIPKQNSNSMDFESSQTSDWPAQSFQKDKNITIDKTGIILSQALLRKDPYLHYLEWDDLNQLFYSLLLTSDPIFALQACELIYTYSKINPDSLQGFSFFYFLYKKLILFEEFIEATIQPSHQLDRPRPQRKQGILLVQGSLEYLGSNFEQDQFMFKVIKEAGGICTSSSRLIQEGDLCTISLFNNSDVAINYQEASSCIIKECFLNDDIQYFKISMVLLNDQQKRTNYIKTDTQRQYCLRKIGSTKKLFTENKALDSICSKVSMLHSIFQKITLGDGYSNYQDPVRVVQEINLQQLAEVHSLNEELLKTLRSASTNDLTVIQGTHSSRKTELAICITRQWLQQSNLKILVKCDSEIKSKQFFTQLHYFILKHQHHMAASSVIPFSSNVCLLLEDNSAETYSSASKNILNMSANMSLKIKRRLEESQIIVVSNVENMVPLKDCQFNRVILLNAEQIPEQTTWQFLVRNCNQLTLIGDITTFKRYTTQSLLAKSRHGDCSLFERLISSGIKPIILKNRYIPPSSLDIIPLNNDSNKMVNSHLIATLHSNLFFSEPLKVSFSNTITSGNDNNLNQQQKVGEEILIVALKGNEELLEQREEGFYNRLEAECIIGIVNSLMKEQHTEINNIRILVSTKAQEKILNSLSSQSHKISSIVKTLDKPFTQSYDFIIFSGTRSNSKGDIGEGKDPAILSTLLQHTLHKFIFVGDIDLYSQDPTWRQFFLTSFSKKQIFFVSPRKSPGIEQESS